MKDVIVDVFKIGESRLGGGFTLCEENSIVSIYDSTHTKLTEAPTKEIALKYVVNLYFPDDAKRITNEILNAIDSGQSAFAITDKNGTVLWQ